MITYERARQLGVVRSEAEFEKLKQAAKQYEHIGIGLDSVVDALSRVIGLPELPELGTLFREGQP